ncbi:MAG: hypothetical protein IJX63_15660 [Lachnospiraceae bacterium]|nr:hypothetical protein [Lachnospiraceae bacterium]
MLSQRGKSIFIGMLAFVLFAGLRAWFSISNMLFYILACAVFVGVSLICHFAMNQKDREQAEGTKKIWAVLPVAALVIWMVLFFINETGTEHSLKEEELIRRVFPLPLWVMLMAAGTVGCLLLLRREQKQNGLKMRKVIRFIVAIAFTVVTSVQFYAPNIFQDVQGGTYHSHAYTNSVMNVCWLIPYSEDMQALYGHYAIFYMPVLKALHKFLAIDYLTGFFAMTAVIAGISILLFVYVIDYFAKDDVIFYLAMFAIGEEYFMLMQGGVYLQVHPHRMIFPILMTALALLEYKKQKQYHVVAIILIACSVVWSTEVGLVIMLAFSMYRWIWRIMDGNALTISKVLMLIRELLFFAVIPFVIAYAIVTGYNLIAGGEILDLQEFLFPLISDRNYIDNIELPLPDVTHAWIGASALFLSMVGFGVLEIFFPDGKEKGKMPFYFYIGVMSLGLMLYYINRPVEGSVFIILFLMLLIQTIILQKCQEIYLARKQETQMVAQKPESFWFLSLRVVTTFILFVMAFDSLYSMPKALKTSAETIWKREELQDFAEYIWVQVPPDAKAFGEGVPELYSMIDRDTHLHTTEWSYKNTPLDTMEKVRYDLEDEQWFFCAQQSIYYMELEFPGLSEQFVVHEVFEYNGAQFAFYRKPE